MNTPTDNPEDLEYCSYCDKPIYKDQCPVRSSRHNQILHVECLFKLFRNGKVTVEADENGDAYYQIDLREELENSDVVDSGE